jgi:cellulose biosynthesis protein BcsQ
MFYIFKKNINMRARIGTIGNLGGGTGKTTVTKFTASKLNDLGFKVLLIDTDLQGDARECYEYDLEHGKTESELFDVKHIHSKHVKEEIKKQYNNYDYIFIDVPPNFEQEGVIENMYLFDFAIIPTHHGNFRKSIKYYQKIVEINGQREELDKEPINVKFALYMMPKLRPTEIADFEKKIIQNNLSQYFLRTVVKHYDKAMSLPGLTYRMEDKTYYDKIDMYLQEIINTIDSTKLNQY